MNMELFKAINNLANKNEILDNVMIFFSKDVPYVFMAIIGIVFLLGITNRNISYRKAAVNTFIITVINLILSFIIGGIYYEDRPFVHNKVNLLFPHVEDAAFPSDHATGTMSIALGFIKYNKLLSVILTITSIIVGFSRVYVGHHYPADVIGAYIMVCITSYIYNSIFRNKIDKLYEIIENKLAVKLNIKILLD